MRPAIAEKETSNRRRLRVALIVAVTVIVVGGLLVLVVVVPPIVVRASRPDIRTASAADQLKSENDLRGTLVTMLAGVAVAAGTVVAALNFATSRAALEETQLQNRLSRQQDRDQLELTRRGQITERFSKAIDQLGERGEKEPEKLDIRLGGIFALEQIARDSPELHWPIVEILTAFIREHTKLDSSPQTAADPPRDDQRVPSNSRVTADIQAALTVLGRREVMSRWPELGSIDLRKVNLQRADLREANLRGAKLAWAKLNGAHLQGAHLDQANLHTRTSRSPSSKPRSSTGPASKELTFRKRSA
ncbi:MAG: pentapeptide repeat-containing protein [Candidatus Dormibacteraeota bacterium]|nr:pentapeptide repeat-containing protein [Candidatus Dormibacteraeota bacterium]